MMKPYCNPKRIIRRARSEFKYMMAQHPTDSMSKIKKRIRRQNSTDQKIRKERAIAKVTSRRQQRHIDKQRLQSIDRDVRPW